MTTRAKKDVDGQRNKKKNKSEGEKTKRERKGAKIKVKKAQCTKPLKTQVVHFKNCN
jgi:hypothetical protein